jgi:phosphatidylinositol-3-phosphatase
MKRRLPATVIGAFCASLSVVAVVAPAASAKPSDVVRAAVDPGNLKNIMVIELENQFFDTTFGATSPAVYLNSVVVPQGQLIVNYYATSHVSQGNYVSQISGQASLPAQNNDCINFASIFTTTPPGLAIKGDYTDVVPGTPAANGQIVGNGCVFPAAVPTIADQLDAKYGGDPGHIYPWRAYMEDMGNNPTRDYGTADPAGGTTCAHPPVNTLSTDQSNNASAGDGYATRHNPFMYFHSIIDNQALCDQRVVPLGSVSVGAAGAPDTFSGHLAEDLLTKETTPRFSFVVPNLCNDAHDARCAGPDVENGNAGGLLAADKWLKHWMPMILNSPAYLSGQMLVMITFDEAGFTDTNNIPGDFAGPNNPNPGSSPLLRLFGAQRPPTGPGDMPGGGKVGAVMLNAKYIQAGTRNTSGQYNHYSALRSFEDLLGLHKGGTDGLGHLGLAALPDLVPFGPDVFVRAS